MEERVIQQRLKYEPYLRIAGLTVAITGDDFLLKLGKNYLVNKISHVDFTFDTQDDALLLQRENPLITWEKCCYVASSRKFYSHLLSFGGFVLHASAVVLDGKSYLFSADSGTGKSTHTALWCQHFGSDRAYILNDDKPIIRKVDGKYLAFGAPWCGSSNLSVNGSAPIQGVTFLEQDESDWIQPIRPIEALSKLLHHTEQALLPKGIMSLLSLFEDFITHIPIYRMGCTISKHAILTAFNTMSQKADDQICKNTAC